MSRVTLRQVLNGSGLSWWDRVRLLRRFGRLRMSLDHWIKVFRVFLDTSADHAHVYANIMADQLIERDVWMELIRDVLALRRPSADELRDTVQAWAQRHKLAPMQRTAKVPPRAVLGRAVPTSRLPAHLASGAPPGPYALSKGIWRASSTFWIGRPPAHVRVAWRNVALGNHVLWSTFDPRPLANPFEFLGDAVGCPWEFCNGMLGLPGDSSEDLVLLCYELPPRTIALVPTVIEAYAGSWNYHFVPAQEPFETGHARPWEQFRGHPRRPEVVHAPITGDCLVLEPRLLRKSPIGSP